MRCFDTCKPSIEKRTTELSKNENESLTFGKDQLQKTCTDTIRA